jgi:hypothetical protein
MNREKIQGIALFALIISLTVWSIVFLTIKTDRTRIEDAVRIARLSIDTEKLKAVYDSGKLGYSLLSMPEYVDIVGQLNRITTAFGVPAKWSYIARPADDEDIAQLPVLTVKAEAGNEITLPGYLYDIKDYPAMQKAVYGEADIVVSSIVWDETYQYLTRSGFAKLYYNNEYLGVLGVDIKTNHVIMQLVYMVLFSFAGILAVCLAVFKVAVGFGLVLNQREWEKVHNRDC